MLRFSSIASEGSSSVSLLWFCVYVPPLAFPRREIQLSVYYYRLSHQAYHQNPPLSPCPTVTTLLYHCCHTTVTTCQPRPLSLSPGTVITATTATNYHHSRCHHCYHYGLYNYLSLFAIPVNTEIRNVLSLSSTVLCSVPQDVPNSIPTTSGTIAEQQAIRNSNNFGQLLFQTNLSGSFSNLGAVAVVCVTMQ